MNFLDFFTEYSPHIGQILDKIQFGGKLFFIVFYQFFGKKIYSRIPKNLVFLLWGNDAKKKGAKIDRKKHLVLESGHPSPLSVRFFQGCSHFSKTNKYLKKNGFNYKRRFQNNRCVYTLKYQLFGNKYFQFYL